ncbi:MAG: dTDP-glucose 4,6-dehydratase [Verrucomicrobiia bacterium]
MSIKRSILITGGAGFIGSNFIHYILKTEPEIFVVNLDSLTYAANLENLKELLDPNRYIFIKGDICDKELVCEIIKKYNVSIIVHFAAESHVDRSILGPEQFIQTNVIGTFSLLESARKAWIQEKMFPLSQVRFHHISTDEVYGSLKPDEPPFTESTPYKPNSPYAASKAASDHLVRAYFKTYGLPITITNCSNNYGPYQFPEKLIPLTILNAINGKPIPIYGDGKQIRDWLYVEDHCEAIWLVINKATAGETYNIGGENQITNLELVKNICQILDELLSNSKFKPHQQLLTYVADRPGHDRRYAMNIEKIKSELGWKPRESLFSGLEKTVRWYLKNQDWTNKILTKPEYKEWINKNYQNR